MKNILYKSKHFQDIQSVGDRTWWQDLHGQFFQFPQKWSDQKKQNIGQFYG